MDGFVAKYKGDGVFFYFGYPQAHEDEAERADRVASGLTDAVGRLDLKSVKLQARVGIATGLVVVGELIGEGSAHEQSVVGETPNLAARLQALAEPDAVVIAGRTRRLVGACSNIGASARSRSRCCLRRSRLSVSSARAGWVAGSRRDRSSYTDRALAPIERQKWPRSGGERFRVPQGLSLRA